MSVPAMRVVVVASAAAAAWLASAHAAFLAGLWIVLLLACLSIPPAERRLVGGPWLAVILAVAALSWTVALDHELAARHTLVVLAAVLLFGLARWSRPGRQPVALLALVIAAAAVTAARQAAGSLQAAAGDVTALAPGLRELAAERIAVGRAFGTASLPAHFAILLVCAAAILLPQAARARGAPRIVWWAGVVAAAVGIVLTRSLAAVAVAGVLALVALGRGARGRTVWVAAAGLALALAAVVAARTDLATVEPLRLRWVNWRTAAWVIGQHPLAGVGLGGVGQAGLVGPTGALNASPYAHCTPLELVAELGLGGLGLLLAGAVALVRLVRTGLAVEPGLALAVAAVPLHNLVDFSLYAPEVLLPWAVLAGALAGQCLPPPRHPTPAWLLVPLLAAGALAGAATWRGEALARAAQAGPAADRAALLRVAARWQPWSVTPLLAAAETAWLHPGAGADLPSLTGELLDRDWVRPASPAWAEAMARLRLLEGRRAEALPFALAAQRRAPWRPELAALVATCEGGG